MRCCGAERTTPYCPSCGKRLANPSPLVETLESLNTALKRVTGELKEAEFRFQSFIHKDNIPGFVTKARAKVTKIQRQIAMLEMAMSDIGNNCGPYADWLTENGFEEAAKALLGAFKGTT